MFFFFIRTRPLNITFQKCHSKKKTWEIWIKPSVTVQLILWNYIDSIMCKIDQFGIFFGKSRKLDMHQIKKQISDICQYTSSFCSTIKRKQHFLLYLFTWGCTVLSVAMEMCVTSSNRSTFFACFCFYLLAVGTMGRIFLDHIGGTRLFSCANCDTILTNRAELISTRFTGATGRAFLFNKVPVHRLLHLDDG